MYVFWQCVCVVVGVSACTYMHECVRVCIYIHEHNVH